MPRAPIIATWPEPIREQLNSRLRATAYSSLRDTTAWLAAQGYVTSRSALHAYTMKLRQIDADDGVLAAKLLLKRGGRSNKELKVRRAGEWRSRLAAASSEIGLAIVAVDRVAQSIPLQPRDELTRVATQLAAVRTSLDEDLAGPAGGASSA